MRINGINWAAAKQLVVGGVTYVVDGDTFEVFDAQNQKITDAATVKRVVAAYRKRGYHN